MQGKKDGAGGEKEEPTLADKVNIPRMAKFMSAYLEQGKLRPEIVATQKGFYRIFAAWILDESLPWTTGEAPTLRALFDYIKVRFQLPSDTTVRNYVARIFIELHGLIDEEFAVSFPIFLPLPKLSRLIAERQI